MDVLDKSYSKAVLTTLERLGGKCKMSDLKGIATNWRSLVDTVDRLSSEGYLLSKQEIGGRRMYTIQFTEKGRAVAEQLRHVEEIASGKVIAHIPAQSTERLRDQLQTVTIMHHVNIVDDVIRVGDWHGGKKRIADVQVKMIGKRLHLYCDLCRSESCEHVDFVWVIPAVRAKLLERATQTRD
jgi:DNA-binding MarR family transcriptional regulator